MLFRSFSAEVALELEIPRVLVPPHPGIVAATGLLATDLQHEFVGTDRQAVATLDAARLQAKYDELVAQAVGQLDADAVPEDRRLVRRLADCRYAGQGYEVRFDVPAGDPSRAGWTDELVEAFHIAHEGEYGHRFDAPVEIINIRVVGIGRIDELEWPEAAPGDGNLSRALIETRDVVFDVDGDTTTCATPFYERERLGAGDRIEGPAIIEQYDTTTIVPPGFIVDVDRYEIGRAHV